MKIAVLGAGALGGYYGARLVESGQDVSFIMRSDYEHVNANGLRVHSVDGDVSLDRVRVCRTPDEVGNVDLIVIAWKTTSNDQLAEALPPLMGPETRVLTLQNGMGNAELISEVVPPQCVYVGLCFICAMKDSPGVIRHLEGGNIQFAPFIPSPEGYEYASTLATLFGEAKIPTKSFEQAEQIQWYKLVWNIPFNGLCLAKGGISIAELYSDPDNVARARAIMEEVVEAARARGYELPSDIVDYQMKRTENMGEFVPSSAVDYQLGRPVEYHAIWGCPLAKARQSGASIPAWEQLDGEIRERLNIEQHL